MAIELTHVPPRGHSRRIARLSAAIADAQSTYALKVALVTVLSLYTAFLLDLDHTYWALITIPLIVRPDGGTTVWRATTRLVGTLLGCLSGFVLAVMFGQIGETAILALAIFVFLVAFFGQMQSGLDVYAYGSAGLVTLTVVIDTGAQIDGAFALALERTTETAIPVIVAFVVMLVVFPRSISVQAADSLRSAREATLSLTGRILRGDAAAVAYEPTVLPALGAANSALRGLAYERTRRHHLRPRMTAVANALNLVAIRAETGRFALDHVPQEAGDDDIRAGRRRLAEAIDLLPPPDAPAADALAAADAMAALCDALHPRHVLPPPGDPLTGRQLRVGAAFFRMRQLALGVEALLRAEADLADPSRPAPSVTPMAGRYFDPLGAAEFALRPTLLFLVLTTVWLATAWPNGQVLALIGTAITLIFPTIVPRAVRLGGAIKIGLGIGCGGVFAMVLMAVLPNVEGFAALALILGGAVFAIFYVARQLPDLPFAIGSIMAIAVGFQPQNTPSFDPITLVNALLTLAFLPVAMISALTIVFPEDAGWVRRHLRRATDALLGRAARGTIRDDTLLEQFIDVLADLGLSVAPDDARGMHLRLRARAALIASGELSQKRRLETRGHLPPELGVYARRLTAALTGAARRRSGAPDCPVFEEVRGAMAGIFADPRLDEEARVEALRYTAVAELLAAIIATGSLARRPEVQHAS
ncbi:FUSC family protein [Acuticoccus sp. I52.16.1]|uniref:FUSC family protein n=1 Tax=Acuticoccus sp. I52.16.1 TaxID=2928472 RepID=UPI001FD07DB1|nr:FUSC family protein [Acuticoccus sp. I52.16.1]UOM35368.1 FUSC family protein [Acuticoccus sp. I52.16.1]